MLNICENLVKQEITFLLSIVGFWVVRDYVCNKIMEFNPLHDIVVNILFEIFKGAITV